MPVPAPPSASRRPWHAVTTLAPLAVVTWAIEPERLARILPAGIVPDVVEVDGGRTSLGSLVAFCARRFRFRGAPFLHHSFCQIDHRVHVRRGDQRGIWFVAASIDSPLAAAPRCLWAMPWHRDDITVENDLPSGAIRVRSDGGWRGSEIVLEPRRPGTDHSPLERVITDPHLGWFPRTRGGIATYEVRHPPFDLEPAAVVDARAGALRHLGLIDADQPPVAAMVGRCDRFELLTPPRRLR